MERTNKLSLPLQITSFISILLVISFMLLSQIGSNGIYTYTLLGILYELLWLPSLAALFGLPFIWLFFALKKKITLKQLVIPLVLLLGTALYLLLLFP